MRRRLLTFIVAGMMLLATACGNVGESSSTELTAAIGAKSSNYDSLGFSESASADSIGSGDYADYEEQAYESDYSDEGDSEVDLSEYDTSRKLIYTSYINLESKQFDDDVDTIKELVSTNGGYFESTSSYGNEEYGSRSASFTARIPSDKYETFMSSVGEVGSLASKSESVDDITSDYVDVQARLKSLNTKLDRLLELEEQADNLEDLLAIEDRINEVQYQIESYTAQKKIYDNQVDYSTVSIDITEVVTYSETKADTAWNRFVEAFGDSFAGFITFLQGVVIAIIYLLPYLIFVAIILIIVLLIRKKKGKGKLFNRKMNKEKNNKDIDDNSNSNAL